MTVGQGPGPDERPRDEPEESSFEPRPEDTGLPEHEQDEYRRRRVSEQLGRDAMRDAGLPEHEDDTRRGEDTGTSDLNP
jgi:hypothetical protein